MSSGFVFEEGEAIGVGRHGEHDFVFHEGEPVPDGDGSTLTFEEGTGIGGAGEWQIEIADGSGSTSGGLQVIERAEPVEDFYGYKTDPPYASAGGEAGTDYAQDGYLTWMVFLNTDTNAHSLIAVYDEHDGSYDGSDGEFDVTYDGLASSTSLAVQDDDSDSYSLNPPAFSAVHAWAGSNTDGHAITNPFDSDQEVTIDLGCCLGASYSARGIGDDKTTVERAVVENSTTITITPPI